MVFYLFFDEFQRENAIVLAKKLASFGYCSVIDKKDDDIESIEGVRQLSSNDCEKECDVFLSIGGDGTMLNTAQRAIAADKPIFGVNAGRIGFLCAFDFDKLDLLTKDDIDSLTLKERMLLEVVMDQSPMETYLAVNDVVLNKGGASKTIELKVSHGENQIGNYRSDGVIVSTPTGSTGYSFSAGGPVIEPSLDIVMVTPVCPHAMFARSIVLAGDQTIRIEPSDRNDTSVYLSVDSSYTFLLEHDRGVSIRKSKRKLKLLTSQMRDYYEMLNKRIRGI